jgi:hypothetical protein
VQTSQKITVTSRRRREKEELVPKECSEIMSPEAKDILRLELGIIESSVYKKQK